MRMLYPATKLAFRHNENRQQPQIRSPWLVEF